MNRFTKEELRRPATIEKVFVGYEDHGIMTVIVSVVGSGWGQGFGCLALKDEAQAKDFAQLVDWETEPPWPSK